MNKCFKLSALAAVLALCGLNSANAAITYSYDSYNHTMVIDPAQYASFADEVAALTAERDAQYAIYQNPNTGSTLTDKTKSEEAFRYLTAVRSQINAMGFEYDDPTTVRNQQEQDAYKQAHYPAAPVPNEAQQAQAVASRIDTTRNPAEETATNAAQVVATPVAQATVPTSRATTLPTTGTGATQDQVDTAQNTAIGNINTALNTAAGVLKHDQEAIGNLGQDVTDIKGVNTSQDTAIQHLATGVQTAGQQADTANDTASRAQAEAHLNALKLTDANTAADKARFQIQQQQTQIEKLQAQQALPVQQPDDKGQARKAESRLNGMQQQIDTLLNTPKVVQTPVVQATVDTANQNAVDNDPFKGLLTGTGTNVDTVKAAAPTSIYKDPAYNRATTQVQQPGMTTADIDIAARALVASQRADAVIKEGEENSAAGALRDRDNSMEQTKIDRAAEAKATAAKQVRAHEAAMKDDTLRAVITPASTTPPVTPPTMSQAEHDAVKAVDVHNAEAALAAAKSAPVVTDAPENIQTADREKSMLDQKAAIAPVTASVATPAATPVAAPAPAATPAPVTQPTVSLTASTPAPAPAPAPAPVVQQTASAPVVTGPTNEAFANLGSRVSVNSARVDHNSARIDNQQVQIDNQQGQISGLKGDVAKNRKRSSAGIASVMASSNIPLVANQTVSVGAGVGAFDGQSAVSVGVNIAPPESRVAYRASIGASSQGAAFGGGISFGF